MKATRDRVIGGIFVLSVLALILGSVHSWLLFGIVSFALLVLCLTLGLGYGRSTRQIRTFLVFLFLACVLLLGGIVFVDRPNEGLHLWLGFPRGTALLVYGIWLVPALSSLIYGWFFPVSVLPEDRLQKFLADHCQKEKKP